MPRRRTTIANLQPQPSERLAPRSAGTALASPVHRSTHLGDEQMGKYFIGWLLGVPAIVLVLLYLVFH
ncbi:hypothetical protein DZC73_21355 [Albitalea terrae]|uniref:Uncharacterized protein n=1 Tax=Piscinibacter terrae TaxID=2496871 RepID=A0A3N7HL59_9BURK|nr:hypothetical protein DZC73_21355 [Albitalea terrae]